MPEQPSMCGHKGPKSADFQYRCTLAADHVGDHRQSGVTWARWVQNGDEFTSAEGFTIVVRRTARDHTWADIEVVPPSGKSWTKRQMLRGGQLPFEARQVVSS